METESVDMIMATSWQSEETLKGRQNVATLGKERPWSGSVANAREMATYTGPVGALDGLLMDVPSGATYESMAEHHKGLDVVREVASEGARPWKMYSGHGGGLARQCRCHWC
ncbi:hypothetical protein COCC4DRAFT_134299 [Bipolaris maydis ATCC 48331]|uniref:Uncharacterized protein n=2 Tax=Cochliobolus heterostrophus TaxID=5016 RepID=M2SQ05_COCH5|nr:uncharacterized protein COCC4DRAFT_134299 [Bipolaris maydis ATCC 48331]EMD87360.1 hypothetical protein COCHEDRAFT_1217550 [Bipolaris maydis C5]ENI06558.1 hypothetical protein COCC4DRAFT_134299 [Bipolaris maydis ATCC 48331]KAH7554761.1 hypothetical protein BM1_07422 [Bipolaris maydis]